MSPATQLFIDHVEPAQPGVTRLELLETDEAYVNSILTVKSFRDEIKIWEEAACQSEPQAAVN